MTQKSAPRDAHSREEETCRKRPRETPECAKVFFFMKNNDKPARYTPLAGSFDKHQDPVLEDDPFECLR